MGPVTKLLLFYHLPSDHSNDEAKDVQSGHKGSVTLGLHWGCRSPSGLECGNRDGTPHSSMRWEGPTVRFAPPPMLEEPTLLLRPTLLPSQDSQSFVNMPSLPASLEWGAGCDNTQMRLHQSTLRLRCRAPLQPLREHTQSQKAGADHTKRHQKGKKHTFIRASSGKEDRKGSQESTETGGLRLAARPENS